MAYLPELTKWIDRLRLFLKTNEGAIKRNVMDEKMLDAVIQSLSRDLATNVNSYGNVEANINLFSQYYCKSKCEYRQA